MTNLDINEFESEVIQATMEGKTANFLDREDSSGNPILVVIHSDIIRNLLLGLPFPVRPGHATALSARPSIPSTGVRVRGACLKGVLDISDSSGHDGNGSFPLLLEDCVLMGDEAYDDPSKRPGPALDAKHARLSRLVLKNCHAGYIDLTDSEILGDLELEGLQALGEGGMCRIEARGIRINGLLKAADVKLNLRQVKLDKPETSPADYALNLSRAKISGGVYLRPRFIANGGINISGACIKGDLWADGAHLIAHGNHALRGQSARIDGVVGLTCLYTRNPLTETEESKKQSGPPQRFCADGAVSFWGAELGTLQLRGGVLRRKSGESENWFDCSCSEIRQTVDVSEWRYEDEQGHLSLLPFESDYPMSFDGAKISGSLNANGAKFKAPSNERGFSGANLEVRGDVILNAVEANQVSLQGAKLSTDLDLRETRFLSLNATDIKIGGRVYWHGELSGEGNFRGACIDGELSIGLNREFPLHLVKSEGLSPTLIFEDANVTRDLKIWVRASQIHRLDWTEYVSARVRAKKLACYDNWQLCEARLESQTSDSRNSAIISFLTDAGTESSVILNGLGRTILDFNTWAGLRLETEEQASDYLKFFCSHLWAERGAFRIIESAAEVLGFTQTPIPLATQVSSVTVSRNSSDSPWKATAFLLYEHTLHRASFHIHPTGIVEMLDDIRLKYLEGVPRVTYVGPIRIILGTSSEQAGNAQIENAKTETPSPNWDSPPAIGSSDSWSELSQEKARELRNKIIGLVEFRASPEVSPSGAKPMINMKGLKVGSLDDDHGRTWGDGLMLDLEGFEYDRFDATETSTMTKFNYSLILTQRQSNLANKGLRRFIKTVKLRSQMSMRKELHFAPVWRHRLEWLNKQYTKLPPEPNEYKPQPYEQLARVFRSEGNQDSALRILIEKLRLERRVLRLLSPKRFGLWILDWMFGYGMLWLPVFRTFLLCWLIGWAGVDLANQGHLSWPPPGSRAAHLMSFLKISQPVLVVDAAPVSTLALTDDIDEEANTPIAREPVTSSPTGGFVREIRCGEQIEPALYALDVFVPLLDLKQESKCTISNERGAWPWRVAKSAYAILGWIVTSALILTISGVIRRQVER